jgi:hypothetical protein
LSYVGASLVLVMTVRILYLLSGCRGITGTSNDSQNTISTQWSNFSMVIKTITVVY